MNKFIAVIIILFTLCGCTWAAGEDHLKKGMQFYMADECIDAMIAWKKAVEEGNGAAACFIGTIYQDGGKGIEENPDNAIKWYQTAIDMGAVEGVALMAALYVKGYGSIPNNPVKGYELIKTVEDSNNWMVASYLVDFYTNGWGTQRDFNKAREIASRLSVESFMGMFGVEVEKAEKGAVENIEKMIEKKFAEIADIEKKHALAPAPTEKFPIKDLDVILRENSARIQGEITNNSGKKYESAAFTLSFYNESNKLLGSAMVVILNFEKNETVTFNAVCTKNLSGWKTYKIRLDSGS